MQVEHPSVVSPFLAVLHGHEPVKIVGEGDDLTHVKSALIEVGPLLVRMPWELIDLATQV